MSGLGPRRLLFLEPSQRRYRLQLLEPDASYLLASGEALCHLLLRQYPGALVIARGPLPFLSGNKTTVGYISPLTGLPHYSFVGGRGFAELLNLGLDGVIISGQPVLEYGGLARPQVGTPEESGTPRRPAPVVVLSGRAPALTVEWKEPDGMPAGQRSAFYWLLERELDGQAARGSIFSVGEGARLGYRTANLAVDGLYHAGRGGAGWVFARFLGALVLRGEPLSWQEWFGSRAGAFWELREGEIRQRLAEYTERLSRRDGGTVTKLYTTGSGRQPTLPARNAQRLGYSMADLGARQVLQASRVGQTGCQWCQVNCRHWHWVDADYAPEGRDRFLDDFEPTYAIYAMLDLQPDEDSIEGRLSLLHQVNQKVILPIEEMGCDVIDVGVGLAALFEGLERELIPLSEVPVFLRECGCLGNLDLVVQSVEALRAGAVAPALKAVAHGPQALAERYPEVRDIVFSSGPGTLGNAGHANALWTFLTPFSRFFGHYVGQLYKIEGNLPSSTSVDGAEQEFQPVVREALQREFFGCLGNALSLCAFTSVVFSQEGRGICLGGADLLVRTLACYGIETSRTDLEWFAESFWARSIAFRLEQGWRLPSVEDYPIRVFETLAQALGRPEDELRSLMGLLICEWKRQAEEILYKYGHCVPKGW